MAKHLAKKIRLDWLEEQIEKNNKKPSYSEYKKKYSLGERQYKKDLTEVNKLIKPSPITAKKTKKALPQKSNVSNGVNQDDLDFLDNQKAFFDDITAPRKREVQAQVLDTEVELLREDDLSDLKEDNSMIDDYADESDSPGVAAENDEIEADEQTDLDDETDIDDAIKNHPEFTDLNKQLAGNLFMSAYSDLNNKLYAWLYRKLFFNEIDVMVLNFDKIQDEGLKAAITDKIKKKTHKKLDDYQYYKKEILPLSQEEIDGIREDFEKEIDWFAENHLTEGGSRFFNVKLANFKRLIYLTPVLIGTVGSRLIAYFEEKLSDII